MQIVSVYLASKNNKKRGSYFYQPVALLNGVYYRCKPIKTNAPIKASDIPVANVTLSSIIKPENYPSYGIK